MIGRVRRVAAAAAGCVGPVARRARREPLDSRSARRDRQRADAAARVAGGDAPDHASTTTPARATPWTSGARGCSWRSGVAIVRVGGESRPLAAAPISHERSPDDSAATGLRGFSDGRRRTRAGTPRPGSSCCSRAGTAGTYANSRAPVTQQRQRAVESSTASRAPARGVDARQPAAAGAGEAHRLYGHRRRRPRRRGQRNDRPDRRRSAHLRERHHARRWRPSSASSSSRAASTSCTRERPTR